MESRGAEDPVQFRARDMSGSPRRGESTRRAIVAATLDIANRSTLSAVSIRQVSLQVGLAQGTFYRHFRSVEAVGLVIVEDFRMLLRSLLRELSRGNAQRSKVATDAASIMARHVLIHREHYLFITREYLAGPSSVRARIDREVNIAARNFLPEVAQLDALHEYMEHDLRALTDLIARHMVAAAEQLIKNPWNEHRIMANVRTQTLMMLIGCRNWHSRTSSTDTAKQPSQCLPVTPYGEVDPFGRQRSLSGKDPRSHRPPRLDVAVRAANPSGVVGTVPDSGSSTPNADASEPRVRVLRGTPTS